jgi:predicted dehydrogenase
VFANQLHRHAADGTFVTAHGVPPGPVALPHCSRAHHFINVLLGHEEPVVHLSEALAVQRILDGIYESAATGREVLL